MTEDIVIESSVDITTVFNADNDMERLAGALAGTISLYAKQISDEFAQTTHVEAMRWMRERVIEELDKRLIKAFGTI